MKTAGILEDIKAKIDIVDFISGYVQLKKSGQNWKGLCPFHAEKTPSFMVNQARQIFHCFGCGAGGDVIAFASKYESLSFNETLRMLAKKAGVAFKGGIPDKTSLERDETIRKALREACAFFSKMLAESELARKYLEGRGISRETVEQFRLGYAPSGWDTLLKHLRQSGFSDAIVKESGLAVSGNKGIYDMFRQRIIFPITSTTGHVTAFGGRALDNAAPKYINSPETAVFRKSDTLFGLYAAREEIKRENAVILVEGYMDVVICHQFGLRNVVAPLGTSLTLGQVQKLRAFADNVILVFDGDSAGRAAARRALPMLCQSNCKAKVLLLPDAEDPDSFLRKKGSQSFRELITGAKSMIDFLYSISGGASTQLVREVLSLIAEVNDRLSAEDMLIELSGRTRISESILREEFKALKVKSSREGVRASGLPRPVKNKEEYLLLSTVVAFPEKLEYVLSRLDIRDIRDSSIASLFQKLAMSEEKNDISHILRNASEEERRLVTEVSVAPGFDPGHVDSNIEDCLRIIEKRKLDERIRLAEISGDLNLVSALLKEKKKFTEERGL